MKFHPNATLKLLKDSGGATVLEFAIIAPVVIMLIIGIVETSMIMFTAAVMEGATISSSRLGKTGYQEAGMTRDQMIRNIIAQRCGTIINTANITITAKSYGTFGNIGQPEPYTDANHNGRYDAGETYSDVNGNAQWDADMGVVGLGVADEIVLYRVSYNWPIMTPFMNHFIGSNGTFPITSSMLVKNEPYNIVQIGR